MQPLCVISIDATLGVKLSRWIMKGNNNSFVKLAILLCHSFLAQKIQSFMCFFPPLNNKTRDTQYFWNVLITRNILKNDPAYLGYIHNFWGKKKKKFNLTLINILFHSVLFLFAENSSSLFKLKSNWIPLKKNNFQLTLIK